MLKNRLCLILVSMFLFSCTSTPGISDKTNLINPINSYKSDQGPNSTGGLPQGPNSTGGLFTIYNKDGKSLTNTKIRILSENQGNLNPIVDNINTNNNGQLSVENITPELIKALKNNEQKLVILVITDGKEIKSDIKELKFISDKLIEVKVEADIPTAKKVNVSNTSVNLVLGKQTEISATVEMSDGNKNNAVIWSSSDESVATVKNGLVSSLKTGVTVITVASQVDLSVNTKIVVTVVKEVYVSRVNIINPKDKSIITETLSLNVNSNLQLEALDIFDDGTNSTNIIWKSSDETILSVGRNSGLISGLRPGKVTVTAISTNDIKKTATIEVNVLS